MGNIKLILTLLFVLITINTVQANEYNTTDGRGFNLFPDTALSEPLDPKIACHPQGLHCLMLVYENNTFFGRGVKFWFANDFFKNFFTRTQIGSVTIDFSAYAEGYYDNFHLPYDVAYIEDESKYYFFVFNTVYSYDGTTLTTVGNFQSNQAGKRIGMAFDVDQEIIVTFEAFNVVSVSETITNFKGTFLINSYSLRATWSGSTNLQQGTAWYNGTERTSPSAVSGCTTTTSCQVNISMGSFPTFFTGLDYWLNGEVVYQRDDNSSWSVTTNDMSSFGTPTLIYGWDSSIRENLTNTDSSLTTGNQIYSYKRETNTSDAGVWVYNLPLTEVRFLMEGFNPNKGFVELVNITAIINCSKETFTDSDSGDSASIQTPCTEDNILSISSFSFRPNSFVFSNFTIPSNCVGLSNIVRTSTLSTYISPYDVTVNHFDAIFGTRIEGISATLNGDNEVTDENGQAIFRDVFPVNSDNFTSEQIEEACSTILTFTGNEKPFTLTSTKSGYNSKTDTFLLAQSPFDIETDFIQTKNIIMIPINTEVNVKIFSSDGIELKPSLITITIEGSNETLWSLNNQLFNTNIATQSPAKFILLNNTGTFEINVTASYFGDFIVKQNITVSSSVDIDIFTNFLSSSLPCNVDSDCTSDLCIGNIYKKFLSCQSNLCTYRSFDCVTSERCDTDLGCVDIVSLANCTRDSQCENTCSDDFTMINNKCGDNDFCKGVFVECDTTCNSTLGFCQELSNCVTGNSRVFTVGFWYSPFGPGGQDVFVGKEETATCGFSRVNKHFCIFPDSFVITKTLLDGNGKTTDDIIFDPQPWTIKFINSGNDIQFLPASGFCDQFCNMSWVFCDNGCDLTTGLCKGLPQSTDDTLGVAQTSQDIITGFWNIYDAIFPDIHSQSFMWFLMGMGIVIFFNVFMFVAIPKSSSIRISLGIERDIIILLSWIFIGSVAGRFYQFVWIVLTIIAVFVMVSYFNNRSDKVG